MPLVISGATIIDGVANAPIEGRSIWIEGGRIRAIETPDALGAPPGARILEARGRYVIAGLMNANVHLLLDWRLENLVRYTGRYEALIAEAAQVALKHGLTTVFDTCGPRRALMSVRDAIQSGRLPGARIFCAGNIIGLDGPFSDDFYAKVPEVASAALVRRINATWVENVGRHLMWMTPAQVANEVGRYIRTGIDFIKYASNDHFPGAFLAFSPAVQAIMVGEAHRAGITAQAHTMSVEGLRIAIEAGCDLIQHANITGPVRIPEATLELLARRQTGAVIFPFTERRFEWILKNATEATRAMWSASDRNARALIECGAALLLANDGGLFAPEMASDPTLAKSWAGPGEDNLNDLASGHFVWLEAMEQKGCAPMDLLRAATRNIAVAYGKDRDLGTLEPGKIADLLILDRNPLEAAGSYRSIESVIKDGVVIDRDSLPTDPILTRPMDGAPEEEAAYVPFLEPGPFPVCPACTRR